MDLEQIAGLIRPVPDFPSPGILFRDITPLLQHPQAFAAAVEALAQRIASHDAAGLVAIESRGFIFGTAVARTLSLPLLLVRKPGKLPGDTARVSYQLEYGEDHLEMHRDAVQPGRRYAVIDDVLATGGTAAATTSLVRELRGEIACQAFLIELEFLAGRERLSQAPVESLIRF